MKKFSTAVFYIFLCSLFLTACGEPKISPEDSVKAIYDLYILGETKGVEALGMSKEDINAARTSYEESVKNTIRANFSASGQEIDDKTLEELCTARKSALSKLKAVAETTSESEGKATVVLQTTYLDEADIDKSSFDLARGDAYMQQECTGTEMMPEELMVFYTRHLIEAYEKAEPSKLRKSITVECVIQNDAWVPANMSSFGSDLALAITGQDSDDESSQE